jgi:anti-anti-sigma factor
MSILELDVEHSASSTRISLKGELDIASAPRVEEEVRRVLGAGDGALLLDLRELTFMDSTGLRAIVRSHEAAERAGRRFAIVRGPEPVDRVFQIVGLEGRFELLDEPPV